MRDSLVAAVRGSVGAGTWRHYWAVVDGRPCDVLEGGALSCAWFTSSLLVMHGLVAAAHRTVASTVADLERSGWGRVDEPRAGAVLRWEPVVYADGSCHSHLGFSVGDGRAVSTSWRTGAPLEHDWLYRDQSERAVAAIYWHPALDD